MLRTRAVTTTTSLFSGSTEVEVRTVRRSGGTRRARSAEHMTWSHATNALRETHRAIQAPASSRASAAARIAVSDLFPNILTARGAATAVTAATTVPASA